MQTHANHPLRSLFINLVGWWATKYAEKKRLKKKYTKTPAASHIFALDRKINIRFRSYILI